MSYNHKDLLENFKNLSFNLNGIEEIRKKIEKSIGDSNKLFNNAAEAVKDNSKKIANCADKYVKNNPWKSIGFAVASVVIINGLVKKIN